MVVGTENLLVLSKNIHSLAEGVARGITALFEPLYSALDLSGGSHWFESLQGFVKTSGFDDSEHLSAAVPAVVGIPIGSHRYNNPKFRNSSSSNTNSAELKASAVPPTWSAFGSVVPRAMFLFLILDILSLVFVRQSLLNPCTSKLFIAQWMIGGILLGFPATWLVDSVRQEYSFRSAFVAELLLLGISFLWLCFGGARIFNVVSPCVDTIAPLWWLSYVSSVLSLSIAGTVIFCMIVTTVLSLIYGSTAN